ncbi:MAG: hypothetical protein J2P17_08450, partial [Mycobacterium sp.]|nr:hypothetical protein [Mycobacterium sp.]
NPTRRRRRSGRTSPRTHHLSNYAIERTGKNVNVDTSEPLVCSGFRRQLIYQGLLSIQRTTRRTDHVAAQHLSPGMKMAHWCGSSIAVVAARDT